MQKFNISVGLALAFFLITAMIYQDEANVQHRQMTQQQQRYEQRVSAPNRQLTANLWRLLFFVGGVTVLCLAVRLVQVHLLDRQVLQQHRELQGYRAETRHAPVMPHTLTYSPRYHGAARAQPEALSPGQTQDTQEIDFNQSVTQIPTFSQVLENSIPDLITVGFDEFRQPITATRKEFFSWGVGGGSGVGKSSLVAFVIAQMVQHGARIILCDPHAFDEQSLTKKLEPLSGAYICPVSQSTKDMLSSLHFAKDIFEARRDGKAKSNYTLIFIVDEWLNLMRSQQLAEEFKTFAAEVSQEGRKYNVIAVLIAQKWTVGKSGDVADTLTSHAVCRTKPAMARKQTGLLASDLPRDMHSIANGEYYLLDTKNDIHKLSFPEVDEHTLRTIVSRSNLELEPDWNATEAPKLESMEEQRALLLFTNGMSLSKAIKEVYGVSGGRAYQKHSDRLQSILRSYQSG